MSIMDWFKTKPTPATVKDKQTNSPKSALLHREFASHPSRGLTPATLAAFLQAAEDGDLLSQAELFMDMREKDTHIDAELHKREMAVKKLEWSLVPPRNASAVEIKNTQVLEDLIRDELNVGALTMSMLDAIGHGYACIELGWGRNAQGLWYPSEVEHRSPTWFTSPLTDRNTLHLRDNSSQYGVPLHPFGWVPHIHRSRSGYIARTGLFRSLAWPYLYKNYSVRDLAEFLEIYGLPIRLGKYPEAASDKAKKDLMSAVLSIGHHAAGIIPDNMAVELQQVMASGSADSFKVMMDWCEGCISKAILGGTLTSSTGANGNRSLGDVHNEVRLDIRDDDATQIDESKTAFLVYPMAMLNGLFADNRCPKWISDTQEPDDLSLYADSLPKLVAIGAKIPVSYVTNKLKIPMPEGDEPVLGVVSPPAATPPADAGQTAAMAAVIPGQSDIDPTPVSSMSDQLAVEAGSSIKAMIGQIAELVNKAESLEALRDQLLASYGDLDSTELVNVMALGFAAADLSGRFDVSEGK